MATVWPSVYKGDWNEEFISPQLDSLNPENWKATPPLWKLTTSQGKDNSNKALWVKGSDIGLNYLAHSSLYDFDLTLEIIVVDGQQNISWVLRAKDKMNYYLFVLNFAPGDNTKAILKAFVFENGRKVREMEPVQIGYYFPFTEGTLLFVEISVRDNQFAHTFKIQ
jgi:hypothetical protein